jgi:multiple sugar transport system ATP-binding protein
VAGVTLEGIVKKFGETLAVDSLDLEIEDKEFVVLLGASGCGKTTTLNMIAGLEVPTAGHIRFDGEPVEHLPPDMRDISMVFQSIALYPHMSVYDNIGFPLRMAKTPKAERDQRIRAAAALLRIEQFLDRKPHELSGGQRQRVALGRAVVRDPSVFLFDEPLSALDAKLRVDMRVEIKKLHERLGATFVYVTHDQVEALTMADRIAVMEDGRLQQYASPDEIYQRPANMSVAAFVGSPSMNFVPGRVKQRDGAWLFEAEGFTLPLEGPILAAAQAAGETDVTLGIRPESVEVDGAGEASGRATSRARGWVYATEPVGSDLFIDISFDEPDSEDPSLFKIRTRPDLRVRAGDNLEVILPAERLFLFGADGRRIHPRDDPR